MLRSLAFAVLVLAGGGRALADIPGPDQCEWSFPLPEDEAVVTGSRRASFSHGEVFCEQFAGQCRKPAYVLPGDKVLVSSTAGDWTCVTFYGPRLASTGWIASDRLQRLRSNSRLSDWIGEWSMGEWGWITISRDGGGLNVEGQAYWQSHDARGRLIPGGTNTGDLEGEAVPEGNRLRLGGSEIDDCTAEMRLVGGRLFVRDNNRCGGLNVTFTGVYGRVDKRARRR